MTGPATPDQVAKPTFMEIMDWNALCQRTIDADTPEKAWAVLRDAVALAKEQEATRS